jgi:hypothetical protein
MVAFGSYHGLNPGMGWRFALALGLQQMSERAIWQSLLPITAGHASSIALVAVAILSAGHLISMPVLRYVTATLLLVFGVFKFFTYYRHPRWVGMRVSMRDLFLWSFIMAVAHGAGLMLAPSLVEIAGVGKSAAVNSAIDLMVALGLHTGAMLVVMAVIAAVVYRVLGLKILRQGWINFDLIWAVALIAVGATALYFASS